MCGARELGIETQGKRLFPFFGVLWSVFRSCVVYEVLVCNGCVFCSRVQGSSRPPAPPTPSPLLKWREGLLCMFASFHFRPLGV